MLTRLFEDRSFVLIRLGLGFVLSIAGASARAQTVTEFDVPTPAPTDLYGITLGPDGATWFGEARPSKVGRITTDGAITEYSADGYNPYQIVTGPDGNLWIADGVIGRLTPGGEFTNFPLPDIVPGSFAETIDITAGPDGALWFAGHNHTIGRITTGGDVTYFPVAEEPFAITLGPDGNLWYTAAEDDVIGRVTPAGVVTTFVVPGSGSFDIAAGPDGGLWFEMRTTGGIGRLSTSGELRTFADGVPTPWRLTAGPDGNVWFTDLSFVYRITPEGAITMFDVPAGAGDIAVGADGNIWFTEPAANKIARLVIPGRRPVEPLPRDARPRTVIRDP